MKNIPKKIAITTLLLIICFNFIPVAFAKTRQGYIIEYIYQNKNLDETFGTGAQDTAYAVEIIEDYKSYTVPDFLGIKYSLDKELLEDNIVSNIELIFSSANIDIYDLYYFLKALDILKSSDISLEEDLHNKIYNYINETYHVDGGFKPSNSSIYANMISTYFIIGIYLLIDELIINETQHIDWINSCYNVDGGYGGNQTLSSSLITTYYAIWLIDFFNASLLNQTATYNYLDSFYINDDTDINNYGGYLPDILAKRALLSSSYFGTQCKWLIDSSNLNGQATVNWVLGLQTFQDGGFAENLEPFEEKKSSIKASYYAFNILKTFKALGLLNEEIFMVEFNFIILIIILSCIGVALALVFIIYRRRKI